MTTTPDDTPTPDDTQTFKFKVTLHRTELIPDAHGAMWGFSDDYPGKQFLIFPSNDIDDYFQLPPFMNEEEQ